jgi:metal-responsive CopG/Arc/MetJ family transcriptional regulator
MAKGQTEQLLLRPSSRLVEKLDEAVEKFGKRSRNEIAVDILETYFSLWAETEQFKLDLVEQQKAELFKNVTAVYARGKGSKAGVEKVLKDAQSRKKNR